VSQFHPDSLSGKGLSDETISEANDITRGIIEAYEQIKRGRCQV
jgi:DnaJ-domain-containing protein 1